MREAVNLAENVAFGTGDATIATSSSAGVTIITAIEITNTAAGAGTFNLALTAGATSATAANCDFYQVSVAANTTQTFYGYWVLPASTAIHGLASAATMHVTINGQLSVAGG
jgi:hypothetical protein